MVQMAVLGRWKAKSVGLSRGGDKNEEFVFVSCRLTKGRGSYHEACTWRTTPQRHYECSGALHGGELESRMKEA
jgi:hypothetical protein